MSSRAQNSNYTRPSLEALESRLVPDATSYVRGLYADVLGRQASDQEVNTWVQQLQGSGDESSRERVASEFWFSQEHRSLQVTEYYQQFLNRTPSASEQNFWVQMFQNGDSSEVDIQRDFLTSQEYRSRFASDLDYVRELYRDILGREADAGGANSWVQVIQNQGNNQSQGNSDAVAGILSSNEYHTLVVSRYYSQILHRQPDQGGLQAWVSNLNQGAFTNTEDDDDNEDALDFRDDDFLEDDKTSNEEVGVRFLTSQEYINIHEVQHAVFGATTAGGRGTFAGSLVGVANAGTFGGTFTGGPGTTGGTTGTFTGGTTGTTGGTTGTTGGTTGTTGTFTGGTTGTTGGTTGTTTGTTGGTTGTTTGTTGGTTGTTTGTTGTTGGTTGTTTGTTTGGTTGGTTFTGV